MTRNRDDYFLPAWKKRDLKTQVKNTPRDDMTTVRKIRRELRNRLRNGTFNDLGGTINKPGEFISRLFRSSRKFKSAYSFARSEAEFYDIARYADY